MGDQAAMVKRLGVSGLSFKNLTVNRVGLGETPRPMKLQSFVDHGDKTSRYQ